jgi:hypothetical protein
MRVLFVGVGALLIILGLLYPSLMYGTFEPPWNFIANSGSNPTANAEGAVGLILIIGGAALLVFGLRGGPK